MKKKALVQGIGKMSDGHPMYFACILGEVHVQMHDENSLYIVNCSFIRDFTICMYFHIIVLKFHLRHE